MPIINLKLTRRDRQFLEGCPRCGSFDLELRNTHTACYWIVCVTCENGGIGVKITGMNVGASTPSSKLTMTQHRLAKRSAIAAWNRRPGS